MCNVVLSQESKFHGDKLRASMAGQHLKVQGCCLQVRGDWSWYKSCLQLTGWTGEGPALRVCWKCAANKTDKPFTDASLCAAWRSTKISHEGYVAASVALDRPVSGLFSIPGMNLQYISIDWMHCMDLGITLACLGNCLFDMFLHMKGVLSRPGQTIGALLTMIKSAARMLGLPRFECEGQGPKIGVSQMGVEEIWKEGCEQFL
jgi:hypothetical protein